MTNNGMTTEQIRTLISRLMVPGATHSKIDALCHLVVWLAECELERSGRGMAFPADIIRDGFRNIVGNKPKDQ
jgi:hypothetical protein